MHSNFFILLFCGFKCLIFCVCVLSLQNVGDVESTLNILSVLDELLSAGKIIFSPFGFHPYVKSCCAMENANKHTKPLKAQSVFIIKYTKS